MQEAKRKYKLFLHKLDRRLPEESDIDLAVQINDWAEKNQRIRIKNINYSMCSDYSSLINEARHIFFSALVEYIEVF